MKVGHQKKETRRIVAVIGSGDTGVFLPEAITGKSVYINWKGKASKQGKTLPEILEDDSSRKPVYEGESVILQF